MPDLNLDEIERDMQRAFMNTGPGGYTDLAVKCAQSRIRALETNKGGK